jgi:hypothetical protein
MPKSRSRSKRFKDEVLSDEELEAHRDLHYLRAAGVTGANRRSRRRNRRPVNSTQRDLQEWTAERGHKLDEVRRAS